MAQLKDTAKKETKPKAKVEKVQEPEIKEEIIQETRLWDAQKGITVSMRGKEEAHDYRYFPDPDLVPIVVEKDWITEIKNKIPEMPFAKRKRFIEEYNLPEYDVEILISSKKLSDFFEDCVKLYNKPKIVSNWIMGDLLRQLNKDHKDVSQCQVTPLMLTSMLKFIDQDVISGKIAKTVFYEMYKRGKSPQDIIAERGLTQITDKKMLEKTILLVLEKNKSKVIDYKNGKEKLFGFFMGQLMKATSGKANPAIMSEILKENLAK